LVSQLLRRGGDFIFVTCEFFAGGGKLLVNTDELLFGGGVFSLMIF